MADKSTFLVHIVSRRNSTWQGTVTWMEKKKTENFRSMLELIKMIDVTEDEKGGVQDERKRET